jgi:hypothetical protein
MEWWQTLVVALVSPVLPTGALFWQQRRAHDREDRIRTEDRVERARDRWRDDRLKAYTLLLVRLNVELDTLRSSINAVVDDDPAPPAGDLVLVEEALAGVQLVGSAHASGTAEHAYTQLLLAQAAVEDVSQPLVAAVVTQLQAERQAVFEAISAYRDAARADLEVA